MKREIKRKHVRRQPIRTDIWCYINQEDSVFSRIALKNSGAFVRTFEYEYFFISWLMNRIQATLKKRKLVRIKAKRLLKPELSGSARDAWQRVLDQHKNILIKTIYTQNGYEHYFCRRDAMSPKQVTLVDRLFKKMQEVADYEAGLI
jgi:hypothetical protein